MITKREKKLSGLMIALQVFITLLIFRATDLLFTAKVFSTEFSFFFLIQIVFIWSFFLNKFRLGVVFRAKSFIARFRGYVVTILFGTSSFLLELYILSFVHPIYQGMRYMVAFAVLDLIVLVIFKLLFFYSMRFLRRKGRNTRHLIIIADADSRPFIDYFIKIKDWGYHLVSIISPDSDFQDKYNNVLIVNNEEDIKTFIIDNPVDDIFYCLHIEDKRFNLEHLTREVHEIGIRLHIMQPEYLKKLTRNFDGVNGFDNGFVSYGRLSRNYWGIKIKYTFDVIFSTLVLILLTPLLGLIAFLIKIEDGGPVLFKQERIGLNGRKFYVHKFRSMIVNAEAQRDKLEYLNEADGPVFKIENDPRITRIGRLLRKTSLDELPQFYNVIKGQMSVVGPRPPLLCEVQQYEKPQLRRLSMRPGISCSWQVWGRHEVSFEEWMKMDLDYIDHWSILLDLRIIVATIGVIFKANGE